MVVSRNGEDAVIDVVSEESDSPKFGAVGPSQNKENHGRQLSAGSVQVAMEPVVEIDNRNKTPTVPDLVKEFRPSIFDMKK